MRALLYAVLFAGLLPAVVGAQLHDPLNAFDRWWEGRQRANPWMYQLDNTDAKTWAWHGAITYGGGHVISWLTPFSPKTGMRIFTVLYAIREGWNLAHGNHKRLDATMDVMVPLFVTEFTLRRRK